MQRLEVSGVVRPTYGSLGVKRLNAQLNPMCHLLALLGAHHILHVSRIRVNLDVIFLLVKGTFVASHSMKAHGDSGGTVP